MGYLVNEILAKVILARVNSYGGMKATDLILNLIEYEANEISKTIGHLTEAGLLVEVRFALPDSPYRMNRFLLPQATILEIIKN